MLKQDIRRIRYISSLGYSHIKGGYHSTMGIYFGIILTKYTDGVSMIKYLPMRGTQM